MTIGFFSLFIFHSTGITVAINLAIVAAGISLIQVGAFNITMEYTPIKYSGISLGMSVVLLLIGSSIGPAIAGILARFWPCRFARSGLARHRRGVQRKCNRSRGARLGRSGTRSYRHRSHDLFECPLSVGLVVAGDAADNDVHLYLAESNAKTRREWISALAQN